MKVIDLLNKIANGEEIPKKIKWGVHNLEWYIYDYKALDELGKPTFFEITGGISKKLLNDEIEIIEDYQKEIKELQDENRMQDHELERLRNIIKEVREYIMSELIDEWDIKNGGHVSGSDLSADAITPILEILDKAGSDK